MCALRGIISLVLLFEGFLWLSATPDFADLILNAVALVFVLDIDGLLYSFCLPPKMKAGLSEVPLADFSEEHRIRTRTAKGHDAATELLHHMKGSRPGALMRKAFWLLFVSFFVHIYVRTHILDNIPFAKVIPGFRHDVKDHCYGTFTTLSTLTCSVMSPDCFPYGS
jgi:hypothetical protein